MRKMIYAMAIIFCIGLFIPGIALCAKKSSYSSYYDQLAQVPMGTIAPVKEPNVPETMGGKKAIGYGGNPGLFDGLSIKYWLKDKIGISSNFNGEFAVEGGSKTWTLNIRPKFLYNFSKSENLLVNIFAGCDILLHGDQLAGTSENHFVYVFAGISPEWFIAKNFSIEYSFGVYIELFGSSGVPGGTDSVFGLGIFGETINLNSINFHIYF